MADPGALDLLTLQQSLRRIAHATEVHSRRIDRELGLTLPQLSVLSCVRDLGGTVTSRAIAAAAYLSPPTVVGILDKLAAKGMVVRERSDRDRRIVHVRLTEAGAQALARIPVPAGEAFRMAFLALDPAARARITEAFHCVAQMMEASVPQGPVPPGRADAGAPAPLD